MKRILIILICLLLLTGCAPVETAGEGYTFTDDTGAAVTVPEKPETVAVLLSSLADLWLTAGGAVEITVGESVERGFAEKTAILVDDGAGKTVNLELLVASKPDLVLYSPDIAGQAECAGALRELGIPVAGFRVDTFDEYLKLLKICTDLTGKPERYDEYGLSIVERINDSLMSSQDRPEPPNILFVRAGSSAKYTKAKTAENNFVCVMLKMAYVSDVTDIAYLVAEMLQEFHEYIISHSWSCVSKMSVAVDCRTADVKSDVSLIDRLEYLFLSRKGIGYI